MRQLCLKAEIRCLGLAVAGREEGEVGVGCGVLADEALTAIPIIRTMLLYIVLQISGEHTRK